MSYSDQFFFVIDSIDLQNIDNKLYGYIISRDQIIRETSDVRKTDLTGVGAYVYIENRGSELRIYQDYSGSFGLYLYKKEDYFAVSNSFVKLLDYVKKANILSINQRYLDHYFASDYCTFAYEETAVQEIKSLDRAAAIIINKDKNGIEVVYHDYNENTIDPCSAEGLSILDKWYEKYTSLFRSIRRNSTNIQVDLSGGFDSRISYMLYYTSGADLSEIMIRSMNDGLHTHAEDYEIAQRISGDAGVSLNHALKESKLMPLARDEIEEMSFDTKLFFHKQMYFNQGKYSVPLYHITGAGGELIREYLAKDMNSFIEKELSRLDAFPAEYKTRFAAAHKETLENTYDLVKKRRKPINDINTMIAFYRETGSRNHFGKQNAEKYQANIIRITPLLDPDLQQLEISTEGCKDNSLLVALILDRYCPKMLEYPFEGGRSICQGTIDFVKEVNRKTPYYHSYQPNISKAEESQGNVCNSVTSANDLHIEDSIKTAVCSKKMRDLFSRVYEESVYRQVCERIEETSFHPLSDAFVVIAVCKLYDAIHNKDGADGISGFLNEVLHDKQETIPQRLWRSVKNRLAVKKAGQDN